MWRSAPKGANRGVPKAASNRRSTANSNRCGLARHTTGDGGTLLKQPNKNKRKNLQPFTIVTANTTSWQSARNFILESEFDLILLQETKSWPAATNALRNPAAKAGYCFVESHPLGDRKIEFSGGIIIAWKRHLRVDTNPVVQPSARFRDVTLRCSCLGGSDCGQSLPAPRHHPRTGWRS